MRIAVSLKTSEYRGDHATDVVLAYETLPDETVDSLVTRVLIPRDGKSSNIHCDVIELRLIVEKGS